MIPTEILTIQQINAAVQLKHPDLDDITMQGYISEVVNECDRRGLEVAAVLIDKVDPRRLEDIRSELKSVRMQLPTRLIINFLDGSVLQCKFEKEKPKPKGLGN